MWHDVQRTNGTRCCTAVRNGYESIEWMHAIEQSALVLRVRDDCSAEYGDAIATVCVNGDAGCAQPKCQFFTNDTSISGE